MMGITLRWDFELRLIYSPYLELSLFHISDINNKNDDNTMDWMSSKGGECLILCESICKFIISPYV